MNNTTANNNSENKRNLYFGIDLGTTNSVIAWGNLNSKGELVCNVHETERKTPGGKSRSRLLPSFVGYDVDRSTGELISFVGDAAKEKYGDKQGYVSKSIKSQMGFSDSSDLADEIPDKTPAQVSAKILSHMLKDAERKYLFYPEDVVITIPASFGPDSLKATIEAAKLAKINTDNVHDILLHEPEAVIYNFIHMQESGEIPEILIDFSTPKNILVFDLGGGTLDVTIHTISSAENGMMNVKKIAISRYTQIGGDNFDELIAEYLFKEFQDTLDMKVPSDKKEGIMRKLRQLAEQQAKLELSEKFDNYAQAGKEMPDDCEVEVYDSYIYNNFGIDVYLTKAKIMEIISPLMANNLTMADVKRIDNIPSNQIDNIIYPILDVLAKAGGNIKIDAVLLNGGMTKFYPIKERVDRFFGMNSFTICDPDLAVAKGAVYYHYCLHKYNVTKKSSIDEMASQPEALKPFTSANILNDTLSLGMTGEYVSKLVEAGTVLPYESGEIKDKYVFPEYTNTFVLEVFSGRGKSKNLPNRRMANRIVEFKRKYPAGTPISMSIKINSYRMMDIEVWITGNPTERAIVSLDAGSQKQASKNRNVTKLETSEKIELNAKSEIYNLGQITAKLRTTKDEKEKEKIEAKSNACIEKIGNATNPEDFYPVIMSELNKLKINDNFRGSLYRVAFKLGHGWKESEISRVIKVCKSHFSEAYLGFAVSKYVLMNAMAFIGEYGGEEGLEMIKEIYDSKKYTQIAYYAVECASIAMMKKNDYKSAYKYITSRNIKDIPTESIFMLAFCVSRELNVIRAKDTEKALKVISELITINYPEAFYGISMFFAEICKQQGVEDPVPKKILTKALATLNQFSERINNMAGTLKKETLYNVNKLIGIAHKFADSEELSAEEQEYFEDKRRQNYSKFGQ